MLRPLFPGIFSVAAVAVSVGIAASTSSAQETDSSPAASAFTAVAGSRESDLLADARGDARPSTRPVSPAAASTPISPFEAMIGDLITTARRRNEPVQAAPVAVSSIDVRQRGGPDLRRLSDLSGLAPSLTIDGAIGAANASRISIRGVGSAVTSTAFDPGVGVFVDGVYQPRAQGQLLPLYDVERIEVIRGPQGTLFGKNTIGGAIAVTTRKPEFEFGGNASVRVGNFNQFDTRLSLNVPLIPERAAARFSIASNYDDGYQNNVVRKQNLGNDRLLGGRGELLLLPTDSVEVLLSAEYTQQDRRPQAAKCKVVGAASPTIQALQGLQLDQEKFARCTADEQRSDGKFASDLEAEDDLRQTALTSQVSWEVNDRLTLRSVTGFKTFTNDFQQDIDGSELAFAQSPFDGQIKGHSISQEFQATGRSADDRLVYVLGLYGLQDDSDDDTSLTGSLMAIELRRRGNNVLPIVDERRKVENRSLAAFGQLTYSLTDQLSVTAGLRRTLERKELRKVDIARTDGINVGSTPFSLLAPGDVTFQVDRSARFSDFSPNATLSYQITPTILTYVGYATGFRSGGFNGSATALNPDTAKIDPEEVTSYEVGVKSTFLDNRLLVNAEAYYGIYEELQRPTPGPSPVGGIPSLSITNAAEARVRGLEVELAALPIPSLRLEAALSAFRARYTDFDTATDPRRASQARLPIQPNYLMSFAASYDLPLGSLGSLSTRTQWVHRGTQSNDVLDNRSVRSGKYGLLSARVAWVMADGRTELSLFGSNLLDREYFNNGFDVSDTVGVATRFQGPPRRYGVEISREF